MNCLILGAGKIGIDLYIKCKKKKFFRNIYIFNRNKLSIGAKFCIEKKFNYFDTGIRGLVKKIKLDKINSSKDFINKITNMNYKILSKDSVQFTYSY